MICKSTSLAGGNSGSSKRYDKVQKPFQRVLRLAIRTRYLMHLREVHPSRRVPFDISFCRGQTHPLILAVSCTDSANDEQKPGEVEVGPMHSFRILPLERRSEDQGKQRAYGPKIVVDQNPDKVWWGKRRLPMTGKAEDIHSHCAQHGSAISMRA